MIFVKLSRARGSLSLLFQVQNQQHHLSPRSRAFDFIAYPHLVTCTDHLLIEAHVSSSASVLRLRSRSKDASRAKPTIDTY